MHGASQGSNNGRRAAAVAAKPPAVIQAPAAEGGTINFNLICLPQLVTLDLMERASSGGEEPAHPWAFDPAGRRLAREIVAAVLLMLLIGRLVDMMKLEVVRIWSRYVPLSTNEGAPIVSHKLRPRRWAIFNLAMGAACALSTQSMVCPSATQCG